MGLDNVMDNSHTNCQVAQSNPQPKRDKECVCLTARPKQPTNERTKKNTECTTSPIPNHLSTEIPGCVYHQPITYLKTIPPPMTPQHKITFQFISEPTDVNFGGNVHGGVVMKWIDQTAYTCARNWSQTYCVTVYVGGIRFYSPISIGDLIKIDAYIIYTGKTSMHIAIDVYSKHISDAAFTKKTHCVIVFVAVDEKGQPTAVKKWVPQTEKEKQLEQYAIKLKDLRELIETEMKPFFSNDGAED